MSYTDFDKISQHPWNRAMYDDIVNTFIDRSETMGDNVFTKDKLKILDIGCGPGGLSLALLRRIKLNEIHILDVREEGLEIAKERINNEHANTKVHIIKASVHEIPLRENSYDFVISRGSMQFWKDQRQALKEIRRILKPKGIAYIGGGRGSMSFQEKRIKEDKDWSPDNYDKDHRKLRKINSNKLENWEYEEFFESHQDSYKIYNHLGDGHWMIWRKSHQ